MLFQVICSRYGKQAATIVTSNKAFSDRGHVFAGDAVMASVALERLLHRAAVINIKGESYRLKEKRQYGVFSGSVALQQTKNIRHQKEITHYPAGAGHNYVGKSGPIREC